MEHGATKDYRLTGSGEQQAAMTKRRQKFVEDFCRKHGWDPKQLSYEQTLKIRKQDEWKNLE
jgi:hypothetical protein